MDKHNYQYAVDNALRIRSKSFCLATVLGTYHRDTTWFSHFLCAAGRLTPIGLGGSAFRDWFAGLYRDGVYLHSHAYRPGLWIASNPKAKAIRGCQDSCARGNPAPRLSDDATWVQVLQDDIPDELKNRILAAATGMAIEGANAILRRASRFQRQLERDARAREGQRETMLAAWEHAPEATHERATGDQS